MGFGPRCYCQTHSNVDHKKGGCLLASATQPTTTVPIHLPRSPLLPSASQSHAARQIAASHHFLATATRSHSFLQRRLRGEYGSSPCSYYPPAQEPSA